jgi:hypothetical protein
MTLAIADTTSGCGLWTILRIGKETITMKKSRKKETHKVGTREQWLKARLKLLKAEKEHTRTGDKLVQMRQAIAVGSGR